MNDWGQVKFKLLSPHSLRTPVILQLAYINSKTVKQLGALALEFSSQAKLDPSSAAF